MKSVMSHSFAQTPRADIPRSTFNLSHGLKTTFDADYLIPIGVWDVIPGDTWNVNANHFARLATPLHPIMDNLYLDTFWFFVPYRLLWSNWEKFCGARDNPADSIDYTIPVITGTNTHTGEASMWDYFGLPLDNGTGSAHLDPDNVTVSALPWRAYALIFNEWFKDQNLQDEYAINTGNGPDSVTTNSVMYGYTGAGSYALSTPLKRGKRHDYFTSALPWPQKGDAVSLPLGTVAPVVSEGTGQPFFDVDDVTAGGLLGTTLGHLILDDTPTAQAIMTWNDTALEADLTNATSATINDLRLAFQTQKLLERDARSGTRYVETLKAHWGVTSPDFRLQRPEYLGGGSSSLNITPVAQTSGQPTQAAEDRLGLLAGYGTVSGKSGFTKSFVEHGVIMGMVNVRSDITYSQGIERYWGKDTRYDFYYPVLSQIGEQAITNVEIYTQGTSADDTVFGYTERYNEYRYIPSKLTGLMRPDSANTLESWHLSEEFTTLPTLGNSFIESNTGTPLDRAIAVPTEPHFIADFYFNIKAARPMPVHGVPGNIDHF